MSLPVGHLYTNKFSVVVASNALVWYVVAPNALVWYTLMLYVEV